MQSPFSRIWALTTKQMISGDEKQNHQQDGEQCTSQKEGKQHTDRNPKQNKAENFSHGEPSKILNYYRICGIFLGVRGFFEK